MQVPKIETELNCRQRRSGKTNWVGFFFGGGEEKGWVWGGGGNEIYTYIIAHLKREYTIHMELDSGTLITVYRKVTSEDIKKG